MSIVKSKHAGNYTTLPNEIFKSDLSIEAIGLLCYFLSLPHNWVIYKTQLHNQLNIGRDKLDRVFNELRNKGYVLSVERRNKGKIEYEHIVYDKPFNGEPLPETPLTEKPLATEQPLINTNKVNKEIKKKEIQIPVLSDFVSFAKNNKPNVLISALELKYKSWVENGWCNGNGRQIKNWKTNLLNTLPYLPEDKTIIQSNTNLPNNWEQMSLTQKQQWRANNGN